MTEDELDAAIVRLCGELELITLHVREPRREGGEWPGFPDRIIGRRANSRAKLPAAAKGPLRACCFCYQVAGEGLSRVATGLPAASCY